MTVITTASPARAEYLPASAGGVDCAIRISTAIAVLAVAGVAAYESYWHAYAVIQVHGESGVTARLEPATIDDLVYASSMVIMYATRHRLPVPSLASWLLTTPGRSATRRRTSPVVTLPKSGQLSSSAICSPMYSS